MLPWRTSEKAVTHDLPSVALFLGFGAVDIHGLPFLVHGPLAHFCACPRAVLCTTHALFATCKTDKIETLFFQSRPPARILCASSHLANRFRLTSSATNTFDSKYLHHFRMCGCRPDWFSSATSPSDLFLSLLRHERRMHQEKCLVAHALFRG